MIKWINKKRNKKGFTLIELVVVIAILGILAAIAIPRLGGFKQTAAVSADKATAKTIATAVQTLVADGTISTAITKPTPLTNDIIKLVSQDGTTDLTTQAMTGKFYYKTDLDGTVEISAGSTAATSKVLYPEPATSTEYPY